MIVACIGTRDIGPLTHEKLYDIGRRAAAAGHVITSGFAQGSDYAFMQGSFENDGTVIAYLPWHKYNDELPIVYTEAVVLDKATHTDWYALAAKHHPAWDRCSAPVKALHARNSGIILTQGGDVDHVIACVSPERKGGTEQGIRVATALGIPISIVQREDAS